MGQIYTKDGAQVYDYGGKTYDVKSGQMFSTPQTQNAAPTYPMNVPRSSPVTVASSQNVSDKILQNQADLYRIQQQFQGIQDRIAKEGITKDGKEVLPPGAYTPQTGIMNVTGDAATQALVDSANQMAKSGTMTADTQDALAGVQSKGHDALANLSAAISADKFGDYGTLVARMDAYRQSVKDWQKSLSDYVKQTKDYRTKFLGTLAPGEEERKLQAQLADLRAKQDAFNLQTEKDKFDEFQGQTLGFAAGRASEIDIKASFKKQEQALEEKNLLTRLGLMQFAREYEGKTLAAQLDFIKDDFDLQTKIQDKLDKQEEDILDAVNAYSDKSKKTLSDILSMFEGVSVDDMPEDTQNQLKSLSSQSGIDFGLIKTALQAQKDRYTFENATKGLLSVSEAKELGVPYGTTKAQAVGIVPGKDTPREDGTNQTFWDAFDSAVLGLPKAQMERAESTFKGLLERGDKNAAKNFIIRTAMAGAGVDQQNQTIGRKQALDTMVVIKDLLGRLPTNIVTGNIEYIAQKAGASSNPDLAYMGSQIQQQIQVYRRAMTGVAFNPSESKEYARIFPDITNIGALNSAKIDSLIDSFNRNNRSALSFYIGDDNYDALFGEYETPHLPSSRLSDEDLRKGYNDYTEKYQSPSSLNKNPRGFFDGFLKVFGM